MNKVSVRIVKIHEDAVVPTYGTEQAAGFDLYSVEDLVIAPQETVLVKTGLKVAIPDGYEMQVRPRSGLSLKTALRVANAPGTVDSDYRGEVCVIAQNTGMSTMNDIMAEPVHIKKGDRIAQGVIAPVLQAEFQVVEELDTTERGSGGFGSTGK